MSEYYDVEAEFIFKSKGQMDKALKPLRDGGWLLDDNSMITEDGNPAADGEPMINGLVFTIPEGVYLNINPAASSITKIAEAGYMIDSNGISYANIWQNGKWLSIEDEDIAEYLVEQDKKDLFLMFEDEFEAKYGYEPDEAKADAFYEALRAAFKTVEGFEDKDNEYQIINHLKNQIAANKVVLKGNLRTITNTTYLPTVFRMLENGDFKALTRELEGILIAKSQEHKDMVADKKKVTKRKI
jgi:hypothetical protein